MKLLVIALAACGGAKPSEPEQIGPPRVPIGPAPATCPGVMYACTDPAVGCSEGAEDFKAVMDCRKVGGTESGHCEPAGTLGSCTTIGAAFPGCSTLWIKKGLMTQTPEDGKAQCAKMNGTWLTTP